MRVQREISKCTSGLVVEYIVAIDVTRVRFPADACWTVSVWIYNSPLNILAPVALEWKTLIIRNMAGIHRMD